MAVPDLGNTCRRLRTARRPGSRPLLLKDPQRPLGTGTQGRDLLGAAWAWKTRLVEALLSTTWRRRRHLVRRTVFSPVSVAGVVVLVFVLLHLIPGTRLITCSGEEARPQDKAELRKCMDLDQSLPFSLAAS